MKQGVERTTGQNAGQNTEQSIGQIIEQSTGQGIGQKAHVDELLKAGKTVQISPQGYSMYPLLVPGRDQVIVAPAGETEYRRGDVVLYRRDAGILVLHRIWRRKADGYYMVGDNQKELEGPLRRDQILGVMICVVRKGRRIPVENVGYRLLTGIWLWMRPVRPVISHAVARVKRLAIAGGKVRTR